MRIIFYITAILLTLGVSVFLFIEYRKSLADNDTIVTAIQDTEDTQAPSEPKTQQDQPLSQVVKTTEATQAEPVMIDTISKETFPVQDTTTEKPQMPGEGNIDSNGLITYRSEKYGFEFKYPSSIAPIIFSEEDGLSHLLTLVFYDRMIVIESLAKNPPEKKPMAKVTLALDLVITDSENSELSLNEFIKSRYYSESEPFFKEVTAGDFEAMEIVDQPEKGYMLIVKVSSKSFLEIGSRNDLKILSQIKPTLKSTR